MIPAALPMLTTRSSIASRPSIRDFSYGLNPVLRHCQRVMKKPRTPREAVEMAPTQAVMKDPLGTDYLA